MANRIAIVMAIAIANAMGRCQTQKMAPTQPKLLVTSGLWLRAVSSFLDLIISITREPMMSGKAK